MKNAIFRHWKTTLGGVIFILSLFVESQGWVPPVITNNGEVLGILITALSAGDGE